MSTDTTPTSIEALAPRYKIGYRTDEWGERSSTPGGIPDPAGAWVRYDDHAAALARAAHAAAPKAAPAVEAGGPLNELEELNLLNKLIELGARAANAHAASNSDDGHKGTAAYVQWQELRSQMGDLIRAAYAAPTTQAAPVAQGDARVQGLIAAADYIDGPASGYAAEHSYTEPSPMAKVAAALRQKAEQEDAAYQARRSDQGLMESEWGPMEDAPPHEDPPMHVAVVEGDDAVRTLQWNRDVAAFAYPVGTLLYAARSQAKEGA